MTPIRIALLTDSCGDLTPEQRENGHIYSVPLRIRCDDGEFSDGVDISPEDVYRRLRQGELPKTSLPTGEDIHGCLERILADGYDGVIAIMLSGALSGTYNMMRLAAEDFSDRLEVRVFDSCSASLGHGVSVLQAAEDLAAGMGWEELTGRRVPALLGGTHTFVSVDTLEYLHKGGRIGAVTATAGTLLKIKPVLGFNRDGHLHSVAKVRGKAQVLDKLVELAVKACAAHKRYNLAIADGGAPEELEKLREKLTRALPDYDHLWESKIGSTLSVYIGDGVLGVVVQTLDEEEN